VIRFRLTPAVVKVIKAFNGLTHTLGAILGKPGSRLVAELFKVNHGVTSCVDPG
jgi:hypothetical protein